MRFWDTSAVVPLCVDEAWSETAKQILSSDSLMMVWWGTRTECVSAVARQVRNQNFRTIDERQARHVLGTLSEAWMEIHPSESLRSVAERSLAVHPLRAADAFQLAAALQWCAGETVDRDFVSFDVRLREAGYREGFTILPEALS